MYIIPYIHNSKNIKSITNQEVTIHTIYILCDNGGEALWQEDSPIEECLEPNDLFHKKLNISKNYAYAEINQEKTNIKSMYSYEEIEPESDILCWRRFIYITEPTGTQLIKIPEPFDQVLKDILLLHTA
jgi:hypothetical protein